ncbi:MAG: hypothetical protein AAGN82_25885 [Myxococcota bacterium]
MSKLDEFESAFKSASKARYRLTPRHFETILVITDLSEASGSRFTEDVKDFLSVIADGGPGAAPEWTHHTTGSGEDVVSLLEVVERVRPDLICTYRNLHERARAQPFSLGSHVDVLTQATTTPVMLLPFPAEGSQRLAESCKKTYNVMVLTDHLTGSDDLIDHGVRFTEHGGTLVLVHLEDDAIFERYMSVIGKIPALDTEVARDRIAAQLQKEPADYIASVVETLSAALGHLTVVSRVRMGHRVRDCATLIEDHAAALVVMNTKDEDQLAMHGLAYPLAVELRDTPLLLL